MTLQELKRDFESNGYKKLWKCWVCDKDDIMTEGSHKYINQTKTVCDDCKLEIKKLKEQGE